MQLPCQVAYSRCVICDAHDDPNEFQVLGASVPNLQYSDACALPHVDRCGGQTTPDDAPTTYNKHMQISLKNIALVHLSHNTIRKYM